MSVFEIVFSPCGGTEKAAKIITERWGKETVKVDLCDGKADLEACRISEEDTTLIALPSYGGRVPALAAERLRNIKGNGASCTLLCVYGNREYEDTLVEMEDLAKECGFNVVAAIAAVAEHSILPQYATGRPDAADKKQLEAFADQIADRKDPAAAIPGNRPYKKAGGGGMVPKAGKSCTKCGVCAKSCPAGAIDPATLEADPKKCISCMRCVKLCPEKTRKVNGAMVAAAALALKKVCSVRKENELFL